MNTVVKNQAILADLRAHAEQALPPEDREDALRFIEVFYGHSALDDMAWADPPTLLAIAHSMWRQAATRPAGTPLVRVFNPDPDTDGWSTSHTVIQIVNDDMPFLVDSITGGLVMRHRMRIHIVHHPICIVDRDKDGQRLKTVGPVAYDDGARKRKGRESYMYLEIDAQSDPDVLAGIQTAVTEVLADVRLAVKDWRAMLAKVEETIASLTVHPPPIEDDDTEEAIQFLRWLSADNFTFLGFREYRFEGDPKDSDFTAVEGSGLGMLRDAGRYILRGPQGLTAISAEIRHFLTLPEPVIITKANVKATVHRPIHLDYVGVKIFDEDGRVIGERRFVGLFTSLAYSASPLDVPLLRRKVRNVQRRAVFDRRSHAGKALTHILETFPRDELCQVSEDGLLETALGILHLSETPRPRAFIRRDKFERFVSALVYVPRDVYHSGLRSAAARVLCEAFNGEVSVYYAQLSDDVLARWHFIIRTKPGEVPDADTDEINRRLVEAAKDWTEHLHDRLVDRFGEETGNRLHRTYAQVFSIAYREDFEPAQAIQDVVKLESLAETSDEDAVGFDFYRHPQDPADVIRLKIYHSAKVVPLSDCLPMLENLGFKVIGERPYELQDGSGGCIHDFDLTKRGLDAVDQTRAKPLVEELLGQIWRHRIEDDGFNALTVDAGLDWGQVVILRAYAKYLRQIGLPYSQDYVEDCLAEYPDIAIALVGLFEAQFDPDGPEVEAREAAVETRVHELRAMLERVTSLDKDRILRTLIAAIHATVRTNYYQHTRGTFDGAVIPGLALKICSGRMKAIPKPRPFAEIFVYSPRVEGVHLRGGPVARGGLRWSDRPEDFRTEILGLVKAQQVKNAVIVPVGAKGGFVPKKLPVDGGREAVLDEGIACYKIFIASLLSVTDNLADGRIVPPGLVWRRDEDDPYLVVAADKGTAAFSDIANDLSTTRGFWLGDAFASGGSNGYDHKKMGITARGAWVSVQRHFREMGINVQTDPVDVIGIGDMSGDVFGNGMLLSKALRLKAAFDHRHIFLDPDPDPVAGWDERKRLFELPRSSWEDYDTELISKGGGVFSRDAKAIALTDEIRAFLDTDADSLTPAELLHAILKAPADLMWIGGIGTYVKATGEAHGQVGDRANDAIRVDAPALKVRVVGEGGNLGLTQPARIEFARAGGRLNTDFIDNSAGVDCSDKEVNIKILLADAVRTGALGADARDALLAEMTDEVADIVLEDNYLQTQAISLAEAQAVKAREHHVGLIRTLEREDRLDREIEVLPSDEQFAELGMTQQGLTRPEIATLLAYAKMSLNDVLLRSPLVDSDVLRPELEWGFPAVLRDRFAARFADHRLRHEMVATTLANQVVNRAGLTFVYEVKEETGLAVDQIAAAYLVTRDVFALAELWAEIDAQDYRVGAAIQTLMHLEVSEFLKHQCVWFLRNAPRPIDVPALVAQYGPGVKALLDAPEAVLSPIAQERFQQRLGMYTEQDVPDALACRVAAFQVLGFAGDIVQVADALDRSVDDVGKTYFDVGHRLGFDWLRQTSEMISGEDHWEQLAIGAVLDDLADQQRELTRTVLSAAPDTPGCQAVAAWAEDCMATLIRADRLMSDLKASGSLTIPKLSFAARHIRSILPG